MTNSPPSMDALLSGERQGYSGLTASIRPSTPTTRQRWPLVDARRRRRCARSTIEPRTSTRPTAPGAIALLRHGQLADQRIDVGGGGRLQRGPAGGRGTAAGSRVTARVNSSHCAQRCLRQAEPRQDADGQRAEAEEHDEEAARRGQFSDHQHQAAGEPHPPFHARDYSELQLSRDRSVRSFDSCPSFSSPMTMASPPKEFTRSPTR